ncbi:hypothetical protein [Phytohabitans suffuscus]|uniref:hypothetical protein n=1 Tax=Phytohabitans suffuscus TaxID=624315 RepID=UPI001E55699F|nr:hypothetical protein [Phytohabitans suffuscus]
MGIHGGGELAELTARLLGEEEPPGTAAPAIRPVRRTEPVPHAADALSVLVLDRPAPASPAPADFNRRALRDGVPWLLLDARAATPLTVGPLIVPGRTGCLECWWLRRAGPTRHRDAFQTLLADRRARSLGDGRGTRSRRSRPRWSRAGPGRTGRPAPASPTRSPPPPTATAWSATPTCPSPAVRPAAAGSAPDGVPAGCAGRSSPRWPVRCSR